MFLWLLVAAEAVQLAAVVEQEDQDTLPDIQLYLVILTLLQLVRVVLVLQQVQDQHQTQEEQMEQIQYLIL